MKKKHITLSLLVIGIILLCASIIPAIIETANTDIIGGAGFPTFQLIFSYKYGGLYSILAFNGVVAIIAALLVGLVKRKK